MANINAAEPGCLYIVPTPIGNLADMVPRAIDVLQTVDLIAAEDTRHTAKLLQHFQIKTPMTAYHDFSDDAKSQLLVEKLQQGTSVALVSDAGTPLVSDPGYRLVADAVSQKIKVIPIPGACAAIAALSAAGLPSDRFVFEGFPPAKSAARQAKFNELNNDLRTLIFYESPHRILASLSDMASCFGHERAAVMAREVSKTFETFLFGSLESLVEQVEADENQQRGEIVVLVKGLSDSKDDLSITQEAQKLMRLLLKEGLSTKRASAITAEALGLKKNALYQWALQNA